MLDRAGWTLIGLDTRLFGSGLAAEAAQWARLSDHLDNVRAGRPMVVVMHKPLTAPNAELATAPSYRFVPRPARQRLERLLACRAAPLVLNGHVHQFRILDTDGRRHVWAPTTWAVLPDRVPAKFGAKRCGIVSLTLTPGRQIQASLVEPVGITQLTLTHDLPDPYQRYSEARSGRPSVIEPPGG